MTISTFLAGPVNLVGQPDGGEAARRVSNEAFLYVLGVVISTALLAATCWLVAQWFRSRQYNRTINALFRPRPLEGRSVTLVVEPALRHRVAIALQHQLEELGAAAVSLGSTNVPSGVYTVYIQERSCEKTQRERKYVVARTEENPKGEKYITYTGWWTRVTVTLSDEQGSTFKTVHRGFVVNEAEFVAEARHAVVLAVTEAQRSQPFARRRSAELQAA